MNVVFWIAAGIAMISTILVVTRMQIVHSLLYLIVSLLAVSLVFFVLGAPLIAALEVIIYAGAIMVLFIFVVMMLNLGDEASEQERLWIDFSMWKGPALLALILLGLLIYVFAASFEWHAVQPGMYDARPSPQWQQPVEPKAVSLALFGPYLLAVELASILLLAGLVGAYHLARRDPPQPRRMDA